MDHLIKMKMKFNGRVKEKPKRWDRIRMKQKTLKTQNKQQQILQSLSFNKSC